MRVLKFGGTSVADAEAIGRAVRIVAAERGARTVVVSALAGVTDALAGAATRAAHDADGAVAAVEELTVRHQAVAATVRDERRRRVIASGLDGIAVSARAAVTAIAAAGRVTPPLADRLMALGEVWSSRLFAALAEDAGLNVRWVDARHIIRTDGRHQAAVPDFDQTRQAVDRWVRPALAQERIVVTAGFIGSGPDGTTTTLGRGGSDYSAALIGASLSAGEIQIWTDVDGVLTADPRIVRHARPLERLSYTEAHDLATFGAKVIHPMTMQPAALRNIPVRVRNSWRPELPGTLIGPDVVGEGAGRFTAVACRGGMAVVEVVSRDARGLELVGGLLFEQLAASGTPVVLADLCGARLSVAVDGSIDIDPVRARFEPFADVRLRRHLAAVVAVGRGWPDHSRFVRDVLEVLDEMPFHMLARPSATSPLAVVVDEAHAPVVMTRLHDGFCEPQVASVLHS